MCAIDGTSYIRTYVIWTKSDRWINVQTNRLTIHPIDRGKRGANWMAQTNVDNLKSKKLEVKT